MLPKRPRLKGFRYTGLHRYSLTICTNDRRQIFVEQMVVDAVLLTIRQAAEAHAFAIFAYCFMSDHLHIVRGATKQDADLRKFVTRWKQQSGYRYKQRTGALLWQPSYFDRVMRNDEDTWKTVQYVLENPVRKGLVENFADYPSVVPMFLQWSR